MNTLQGHSEKSNIMLALQESILKIAGSEFIAVEGIRTDSKISEDLRFDRFDIFQLREEIIRHFGANCDLFMHIYHLEIDQIIDLTVGNIADFVGSIGAPTGGAPTSGAPTR